MDYESAVAELSKPRPRRKLTHNTYMRMEGEQVIIKLHNTDIITLYPNGSVRLNSGGWQTPTTKDRMNSFTPSPISVWQTKGIWYTDLRPYEQRWEDKPIILDAFALFEDGILIQLTKDGYRFPRGRGANAYRVMQERKRIAAYAKKYVANLRAGNVEAPGAGDCFFCQTGKCSALADHIEEEYFVPRLVVNALETIGAAPVMYWALGKVWGQQAEYTPDSWVWQNIEKTLRRYMYREMGYAA